MIERTMKRLSSNESTRLFWNPVPEDETNYYSTIPQPICLQQIEKKRVNLEYTTWESFDADITLITENALSYNGPDQLPFHQALMMKKDYQDCKALIRKAVPSFIM